MVVFVGNCKNRIAPHATDILLLLLGPSESRCIQMSLVVKSLKAPESYTVSIVDHKAGAVVVEDGRIVDSRFLVGAFGLF